MKLYYVEDGWLNFVEVCIFEVVQFGGDNLFVDCNGE